MLHVSDKIEAGGGVLNPNQEPILVLLTYLILKRIMNENDYTFEVAGITHRALKTAFTDVLEDMGRKAFREEYVTFNLNVLIVSLLKAPVLMKLKVIETSMYTIGTKVDAVFRFLQDFIHLLVHDRKYISDPELKNTARYVSSSILNTIGNLICIADKNLFKMITDDELRYTKKKGPNILKWIDHFNSLSFATVASIVENSDINGRTIFLEFMIQLMGVLHKMKNYQAVMAILSSLEHTIVFRLKATFAGISESAKRILGDMREFGSSKSNYARLRATMNEKVEKGDAFIPNMGLYLTYLTFANDSGNLGKLEEIVNDLAKMRDRLPCFDDSNEAFVDYINLKYEEVEGEDFEAKEDFCYKLSWRLEPPKSLVEPSKFLREEELGSIMAPQEHLEIHSILDNSGGHLKDHKNASRLQGVRKKSNSLPSTSIHSYRPPIDNFFYSMPRSREKDLRILFKR